MAADGWRVGLRRGSQPHPITHGTQSGYVRHRNAGEDSCPECKAAHALYQREYLARRAAGTRLRADAEAQRHDERDELWLHSMFMSTS